MGDPPIVLVDLSRIHFLIKYLLKDEDWSRFKKQVCINDIRFSPFSRETSSSRNNDASSLAVAAAEEEEEEEKEEE